MTQGASADLRLRPAQHRELAALSELCFRAKAVWGYDTAFMEACRTELTLTPRDLEQAKVQVLESRGTIVGVAQVSVAAAQASLDKLFIAPASQRTGAGRRLFAWCVEEAREQGAHTLTIESDPGAADFYRRLGARDAGVAPSGSIPGRLLPLLKLDLQKRQ
jgi:GNAT superfamily N-acetyltransferase